MRTHVQRYNWVRDASGKQLFDVGILDDGTLHNPNGYPDDIVRSSVLAANQRRHDRASAAAKKAAKTRAARRERDVYRTAEKIVGGHQIGPRNKCAICRKGLGAPET